jgi:hypothetical protein
VTKNFDDVRSEVDRLSDQFDPEKVADE